jgi:protein-S-isoprenylcysteine O-methyltransferase Ste14
MDGPAVRVIVTLGVLLFVISLGWGVGAYLTQLAVRPPSWSTEAAVRAIVVDTSLFTLFAVHHSLFARQEVKRRVSAVLSARLERPAYVIVASLLFVALFWGWQTVPGVAWQADGALAVVLGSIQIGGLLLSVYSATRLGVFELAGLRPPRTAPTVLRRTGVYGIVRHPIYLAWLMMVWPAALMTGSRLLFATISTLYLVIAIPLEERTLIADFGNDYRDYQKDVRARMVPWVY